MNRYSFSSNLKIERVTTNITVGSRVKFNEYYLSKIDDRGTYITMRGVVVAEPTLWGSSEPGWQIKWNPGYNGESISTELKENITHE
jgi:hypothetical protein